MAAESPKKQTQSNPIKPNCLKAKMDVTSILTKDYERNDIFAVYENKPNTNPIQTQTKPIKPCPERSRMCQSRNNSRTASCGIWGFFMFALYLPELGLITNRMILRKDGSQRAEVHRSPSCTSRPAFYDSVYSQLPAGTYSLSLALDCSQFLLTEPLLWRL